MNTEPNKSILRRYFEEAWNKGRLDVLDEIVAPHYVNHDPAVPGLPDGPEGLKLIMAGFRAAFPDLRFTVEDLIAEDDRVVTRWTMRGTHLGEFAGLPPTGRQVISGGMQIERVLNGQIVEHWRKSDDLGLMQQLGAIPAPQAAGAER
jgi:steroid delta-isomerase-like uncharacterized protein